MLFESDIPFGQWSTQAPAPDTLMRDLVAIHAETVRAHEALKRRYEALREEIQRYTRAIFTDPAKPTRVRRPRKPKDESVDASRSLGLVE